MQINNRLNNSFLSVLDRARFLSLLKSENENFTALLKALNSGSFQLNGVRIFGSYISNGNANNRTVYEDEKSYFYFNISFKKFCNISIRNINAL